MELYCADGLTGIYCITNILTGKQYIGQAKNIKLRWRLHINALKNDRHYNSYLQNAWNKYGDDAFMFSILEICEISALSDRETYYIETLDTFKDGYNLTMGGDGTRGVPHTEQYKAYMSELFKGRTFSPETRLKMSIAKKGKPKVVTEKTIAGHKICAEKLKGRQFSDEHRKHIGEGLKGRVPWNKGKKFPCEAHPMYGKHHSEEAKRKIGDANRGRPPSQASIDASSKKVRCVETGDVYPSITAAAAEYGVTIWAISNVLHGKAQTCKKMHWEYVD